MQEAKALYDYETEMFEQERTIIEDKRNESIADHAEDKAQKAKTYDQELTTIQDEKQRKKADLDNDLKETNEAFEAKILNSASRLETLIETTTRKIDQDSRLKKERLDTLNDRIERLEDDVYTRVEDAHKTLTETLNATHKAFLQGQPVHTNYDTFQEANDTYADTLIRKTVKAITNRD
jgi:DNA anti-recombination protein RmuC